MAMTGSEPEGTRVARPEGFLRLPLRRPLGLPESVWGSWVNGAARGASVSVSVGKHTVATVSTPHNNAEDIPGRRRHQRGWAGCARILAPSPSNCHAAVSCDGIGHTS